MHDPRGLIDFHERAHRNLERLVAHCAGLTQEEADRSLAGFGYASVRLQLIHAIGAEAYWVGVLQGRVDAEDKDDLFPTVDSVAAWRRDVAAATRAYLDAVTEAELDASRVVTTWKGERRMAPAHVILRVITHLYHHQGQVVAMCRLLGRPVSGVDFPLD